MRFDQPHREALNDRLGFGREQFGHIP
jgi:hypothetical protein